MTKQGEQSNKEFLLQVPSKHDQSEEQYSNIYDTIKMNSTAFCDSRISV